MAYGRPLLNSSSDDLAISGGSLTRAFVQKAPGCPVRETVEKVAGKSGTGHGQLAGYQGRSPLTWDAVPELLSRFPQGAVPSGYRMPCRATLVRAR